MQASELQHSYVGYLYCSFWDALDPTGIGIRISQVLTSLQQAGLVYTAYLVKAGSWKVYCTKESVQAVFDTLPQDIKSSYTEEPIEMWLTTFLTNLARKIDSVPLESEESEKPESSALPVLKTRKTLEETLQGIPDNWDGKGGEKPSPGSISMAKALVPYLEQFIHLTLEPTPAGVLAFEIKSAHRDHPKTIRVLLRKWDVLFQGLDSEGKVVVAFKGTRECL